MIKDKPHYLDSTFNATEPTTEPFYFESRLHNAGDDNQWTSWDFVTRIMDAMEAEDKQRAVFKWAWRDGRMTISADTYKRTHHTWQEAWNAYQDELES